MNIYGLFILITMLFVGCNKYSFCPKNDIICISEKALEYIMRKDNNRFSSLFYTKPEKLFDEISVNRDLKIINEILNDQGMPNKDNYSKRVLSNSPLVEVEVHLLPPNDSLYKYKNPVVYFTFSNHEIKPYKTVLTGFMFSGIKRIDSKKIREQILKDAKTNPYIITE